MIIVFIYLHLCVSRRFQIHLEWALRRWWPTNFLCWLPSISPSLPLSTKPSTITRSSRTNLSMTCSRTMADWQSVVPWEWAMACITDSPDSHSVRWTRIVVYCRIPIPHLLELHYIYLLAMSLVICIYTVIIHVSVNIKKNLAGDTRLARDLYIFKFTDFSQDIIDWH